MITDRDVFNVCSAIADAMVTAHRQDDDYVRGVLDTAEAIARSFGGHVGMPFFAPTARQAIGLWEFNKTPASQVIIPPGEM